MAEVASTRLERSINEELNTVRVTTVDLQCVGKGVYRSGLTSRNPKSHDVKEKMVRLHKMPLPKEVNLSDGFHWVVIIDNQIYADWFLEKATKPWLEASPNDLDYVWVDDHEIRVSRSNFPRETNREIRVDIRVNRLTGGMHCNAESYRGDQLEVSEVFSGKCKRVTPKF